MGSFLGMSNTGLIVGVVLVIAIPMIISTLDRGASTCAAGSFARTADTDQIDRLE